MDDYQKSLLVTLDRNLVKMILPPATFDDDGDDRNAIIALQRALLGLHLQAFIPLAGRFVDSPVLPVDGSQRLRQTVEDVLSLLDSLTDSKYVPKLPKVSDIYPSLGKTLSDLQHLSAIDMVGSSKSSLFVVDSIGVADQACKTLTRANDVLQHIKHEYFEKPPKIGHAKDTGDEDDEYCRHIRVLEREYQYALGRVLDTLKHNFGTCHPEELHEVLVELAPAIDADSSSVPEDKFDTYIYCPKLRRKTAVRCNIHNLQTSLSTKAIAKDASFCEHVKDNVSGNRRIVLGFHDDLGLFVGDHDSRDSVFSRPEFESAQPPDDLMERFKLRQQEHNFNSVQRRQLAIRLVLHLAVFGLWRHTSKPWDGSSIHFLRSAGDIAKDTPYILWKLDTGAPCDVDLIAETCFAAETRNARPSLRNIFTLLAKVLLEVKYGHISNYEIRSSNDLHDKIESFRDAVVEIDGKDKNFDRSYIDAVTACLEFHGVYQAETTLQARRHVSGIEEKEDIFRRLVGSGILAKISKNPVAQATDPGHETASLLFDDDMCELDFHEITRYSDPPASSVSASRYRTGKQIVDQVIHTYTPKLFSLFASASRTDDHMSAAIRNLSDLRDGSLHDNENDPHSLDAQQRRTDAWFENFETLVRSSRTGQVAGARLKVAILDSGIDLEHDLIEKEKDHYRIIDRKSFFDEDDLACADHDNHGTYVTAVILRLTLNVDIYMAKVVDTTGAVDRSAVIKALTFARETWKVDMISMSLGFSDKTDELVKAINSCLHGDKPIIVFASASNDGAEGARTCPASCRNVICVHSANQRGRDVDGNPPPGDAPNLSFVGTRIRPTWGRKGFEKRTDIAYKDGTSYATPVAVSTAAFMIAYIVKMGEWSQPTREWVHSPWTPEGMERLFRRMSDKAKKGDYEWVSLTRYLVTTGKILIKGELEHYLQYGRD